MKLIPLALSGRLLVATGLIAAIVGVLVSLPEFGAGLRGWIGAPLPGRGEHVGALRWLATPTERNAFARRFTTTASLHDVAVMDDGRTILVVGDDGTLLKSVNAGATWRSLADDVDWRDATPSDNVPDRPASETPSSLPALGSVAASPDGRRAIAVGEAGTVLTSDDHGETWTNRASGSSGRLNSVVFDAGTGRAIVVGSDGIVLTSDDRGATWTKRASGSSASLTSVAFDASTGRAIAVGIDGIVLTSDDHGATWTERRSGTSAWLYSVAFDAGTGRAIAVGKNGTVLISNDRGETWTERRSGTSAWLYSVAFDAGTGRAIAVGKNGTVFTSDDHGETWTKRASGVSAFLDSVVFDANTGRATTVGYDGIVLTSDDHGATWIKRASGSSTRLISVVFDASTGRAIAVGSDGIVLTSDDRRATWTERASGASASLTSVAFDASTGRAIAVGIDGIVLTSDDHGATWTERSPDASTLFGSVAFDASTGRAIAVGSVGIVLTSDDHGETWANRASGSSGRLNSVVFDAGTGRAIVVGSDGIVLTSDDRGATWTKRASGSSAELLSVVFDASTGRAIAVGIDGIVLTSDNHGETWIKRASGTSEQLTSVVFDASTGRAIAVGIDGIVLTSDDRGATWTKRASGTSALLISVEFDATSTGRAIAVGRGGSVLTSDDRGATWSIVAPKGRIYPAPLSLLGLLLILGGGLVLLRYKPRGPSTPTPTPLEGTADPFVSDRPLERITDLFVSDQPLGPGDPDLLGYGRYAQGLSGLLRNPGTGFPITIAITGEWGAGKSSFMRLLEADLWRKGYFPAWFNAWHDQSEENVLSSLLLVIRKQAVPRIFSANLFRAVRLRISLLHSRRTIYVIVGVAVVVLVAPELLLLHELLTVLWQSLATLVPAAIYIPAGASTFGLNLRRGVTGLLGTRANSVDRTGWHEKLRCDFKNVSRSIGRNLVIFIDDLDRCQPEKVVETLEAVNFLVTAGECAVVMGMDYKRVQHCVGLARKDLAEAEYTGATSKNTRAERRTAYAHQYLQKLINVEMPIAAERERVKDLLTKPGPPAEEQRTLGSLRRWLARLSGLRFWAIWSAIAVSALFAVPYVHDALVPADPFGVVGTIPVDEEQSAVGGPQSLRGDVSQAPSPVGDERDRTKKPSPDPTPPVVVFWPAIVGLFLVLILGLFLALHRLHERDRQKLLGGFVKSFRRLLGRPEEVRDSPSFRKALAIWSDAVVHDDPTPRKFKRFLNRIRYFAAMLHAENGADFDWKREANLVALAALHHLNVDSPPPAMPGQLDLFQRDGSKPGVTPGPGVEEDETDATRIERILEACRIHADPRSWETAPGARVESPWPPDEREIEQFRKLSDGIHV